MKKLMLIFVFALGMASANAQENLDVNSAIAIALQNNFSLQIARADTQIAANNNTIGNAGFLPKVEGVATYDFSSDNGSQEFISGDVREIDAAKTNSLNGAIQLNWTLFDGFYMFAEKDKLEAMEAQSLLQLKADVEENIAQVLVGYYKIVQQQRLMKSLETALEISVKRAEIVAKQYDLGSANKNELLQAQVDLNADSALFFNQQVAIAVSKAELNFLLARNVETNFATDTSIGQIGEINYADFIQRVASESPQILRAKKQSEISMLLVKQAQAQLYPQLDFVANINGSLVNSGSGFLSYNQQYGPAVGLALRMNIFDGNRNRTAIKNARVATEIAQLQEEELRTALQTDVYTAYQNYTTAKKRVRFEQKSVKLAQANLEIAIEKYKLGSIDQLTFREAQRAKFEADSRLLQAQFDAKQNEILMKKLVGVLVE